MACEVRPIPTENKLELWLKFNFDNKLERELSTELGMGKATKHSVFIQIGAAPQTVVALKQ